MLIPLPSWTSLAKKYFFELLRIIWKFQYLSLKARPWQIFFFLNFFDVYGNLVFKFASPIFINKEKKMLAPFGRPWPKNVFLNFFYLPGNLSI